MGKKRVIHRFDWYKRNEYRKNKSEGNGQETYQLRALDVNGGGTMEGMQKKRGLKVGGRGEMVGLDAVGT